MSWTQAICEPCWNARNPDRVAVRVRDGEPETCAYCGQSTESGIYVRDDPKNVPHPTVDQ